MKIIVSEIDRLKGKTLYTDVETVDIPEFTEENIYHAVRNVYGFSAEYMDEATIHVDKYNAVITWEGIVFNLVRDALLPHFN
jgi:hypothetical protein